MRLFFDHSLGKITDHDWQYSPIYATFLPEEYDFAIETGWLPDEYQEEYWFQARQVRYDLSKIPNNYLKYPNKRIDWTVTQAKDLDDLEEIWEDYLEKKGYKKDSDYRNLLRRDPESKWIMRIFDNDQLVAFSILRTEPALGKLSQKIEMTLFRDMGYDYHYVCPGYEFSCLWKKNFQGFQFWTGTSWSEDKDQYQFLCERDSSGIHLDDLC